MVTLLALIGGIYCVSFATTQFLPGWKSMSLAVLAALALIGSVVYALMQPAFTFSDSLQTWLIVFPICLGLLGGSATRAVAIARSPMSAMSARVKIRAAPFETE